MTPNDTRELAEPDLLAQLEDAPPASSSRRNLLVWIPVFLALFALLGLLGWGLVREKGGASSFSTNDGPAAVAVLSRPATDFSGRLYEPYQGSTQFSLADYRGQVVVINFWASWCPPCREEAPVLEATWRRYRDQGVVFLGIDIWDSEEDARAYMREFGITFPNLEDRRGRIAVEYGVTGIPETYFITPDGMISRKIIGAVTDALLVQGIEEARQAGKEGS